MADREIKTRIVLEGEQQFRQAMNSAASAVKTLNAEEKAAEAQYKASGDAAAYQEEKTRILNEKLEEQKKAVEAAKKAVEQLTKQGIDKNDKAMQQWRTKLANAQSALAQTEGKLKSFQGQVNTTTQTLDNGSQAAADYAATLETVGRQINVEGAVRSIGRVSEKVNDSMALVSRLGKSIWQLEADAGNWADEIITGAQEAGVDVETYQAWQYAEKAIDTSVADILGSMTGLNQKIVAENKETLGILNSQLGVAISNENGELRSQEEIYWDTVDALSHIGDMSRRNNIAMQLFGNSYTKLIPLMNAGGSAAWDEQVERAKELYTLTDEQVMNLSRMHDSMEDLGFSLNTAKLTILAELAPVFEQVADAMSTVVNAFTEFLKTDEGRDAMAALRDALIGILNSFTGEDGLNGVLEFAKGLLTDFTNALKWIKDHGREVGDVLIGIFTGMAVMKGVETVLNIFNGIMSLKELMTKGKLKAGKSIWDIFTDWIGKLFGGGGGDGKGGTPSLPGTGGGSSGGTGGSADTDTASILHQVHNFREETGVTLLNIASDLERIAWLLENRGAIGAASRARSMGASDWEALLSRGTIFNPYTGDIVRLPSAETGSASGGGGSPTGGGGGGGSPSGWRGGGGGGSPETTATADTPSYPGMVWNHDQYLQELHWLASYDLSDFLSRETLQMLYEQTDQFGTPLDPEQIVPQVLAELADYVEHAGELPQLRLRNGQPAPGNYRDEDGARSPEAVWKQMIEDRLTEISTHLTLMETTFSTIMDHAHQIDWNVAHLADVADTLVGDPNALAAESPGDVLLRLMNASITGIMQHASMMDWNLEQLGDAVRALSADPLNFGTVLALINASVTTVMEHVSMMDWNLSENAAAVSQIRDTVNVIGTWATIPGHVSEIRGFASTIKSYVTSIATWAELIEDSNLEIVDAINGETSGGKGLPGIWGKLEEALTALRGTISVKLTDPSEPIKVELVNPVEPFHVILDELLIFLRAFRMIDDDIKLLIPFGGRGGGSTTPEPEPTPAPAPEPAPAPAPAVPIEFHLEPDTVVIDTDETVVDNGEPIAPDLPKLEVEPQVVEVETHPEEAVEAVEEAEAAAGERERVAANHRDAHALIINRRLANIWSQLSEFSSYYFGTNGAARGDFDGANWGGALSHPAFFGHSSTPDPIYAVADILYGYSSVGLGGKWGSVSPRLPYTRPYARGGRIDGLTLAQLGEDGVEYVVPMDNLARARELIGQMLAENDALRGAVTGDLLSATGALSGAMRGKVVPGGGLGGVLQTLIASGGGGALGGSGQPGGGVTARIYMDRHEVGYMVADTVNEVMGAKVINTRRDD